MIDIALVDDHELVRCGLVEILSSDPDINVVYDCSTIRQQLAFLKQSSADIVVTDLSFPNENGMDLLDELSASDDGPKAIVLSMNDRDPYVAKAIEKGAKGYLSKSSSPEQLIDAVKKVSAGGSFLCTTVTNNLKCKHANPIFNAIASLTERERQVFELLAKGVEIKHIGRQLSIAAKTVHVHKAHVFKKLNVHNAFDLTRLALKCGLLTTEELI